MKSGRTIVAKREKLETSSERMTARKSAKRKRASFIIIAVLILAIAIILAFIFWQYLSETASTPIPETPTLSPTIQIVDESGSNKISSRVKEYVFLLEQDFSSKSIEIDRVSLPAGAIRELYINLKGKNFYLKASLDRGTAVTAEDASRMLRYLEEKGITPNEYIDLRVPEKAYYK